MKGKNNIQSKLVAKKLKTSKKNNREKYFKTFKDARD